MSCEVREMRDKWSVQNRSDCLSVEDACHVVRLAKNYLPTGPTAVIGFTHGFGALPGVGMEKTRTPLSSLLPKQRTCVIHECVQ